jgi:hypothetical protein
VWRKEERGVEEIISPVLSGVLISLHLVILISFCLARMKICLYFYSIHAWLMIA